MLRSVRANIGAYRFRDLLLPRIFLKAALQEKAPRSSGRAHMGSQGRLPTRSGSLSVLVDLALRKLRESVVGFLFLRERCFQQLCGLIQPKLRMLWLATIGGGRRSRQRS